VPRKRKSKVPSPTSSQVQDLNLPANGCLNVVPMGLVSSRVNRLDGDVDGLCDPAASDELMKKQKRNNTQSNARSVAAESVSCRDMG